MNKRQKVFEKFGGRCAYCGCELDVWQIDHAVSKQYWYFIDYDDRTKVNDIANLMPSCIVCNHYKRAHCVESYESHIGFRDYMLSFHKRLAKLPKKTMVPRTEKRKVYMQRIANAYGITVDKPFDGKFYFEKIAS